MTAVYQMGKECRGTPGIRYIASSVTSADVGTWYVPGIYSVFFFFKFMKPLLSQTFPKTCPVFHIFTHTHGMYPRRLLIKCVYTLGLWQGNASRVCLRSMNTYVRYHAWCSSSKQYPFQANTLGVDRVVVRVLVVSNRTAPHRTAPHRTAPHRTAS